ncbi:MAG: hypothetical protein GAK30_01785 [Paracidovorax wautersii]|uniref:Medium/long-chain acyl-CoA thioesterase YigI n=1 Tax=Paracidovorax wautersii TaxID=1177982 RepID=A0A7V8JQS4_9BURK|nr:MAG: hypothetical protein GAK30_01785 [Paracidovorax wautersii]
MSTTETRDAMADNPDRALIHALIAGEGVDTALRTSPALEALRTRFVRGEPGDVTLRFSVPADSLQGNGVVAGGTLTSMLDFAMAFAVLSRLPAGKTCATISLTVNMQAPARLGDYEVEASASRVGSRVAFVRAALYDAQRTRSIAEAMASFTVLEMRA